MVVLHFYMTNACTYRPAGIEWDACDCACVVLLVVAMHINLHVLYLPAEEFYPVSKDTGRPNRILFVEELTGLISESLPDFWRLGQAYLSGSLFQVHVYLCTCVLHAFMCCQQE